MSRRQKRQISRELAAIASLKDSDIDTSDIPEITDWSQAVVGRFYHSEKIRTSRAASSDVAFTSRFSPIPTPGPQLSTGIAVAAMTHQQLILECVQGRTEAWTEFVRRFQKLIAIVVMRAARRWEETSPELIEDLIEETYLKLCANDYQLLRKFDSTDAIFGYLKVVASNVVHDHFRSAHASRGVALELHSSKPAETVPEESMDAVARVENAVFMEEIDEVLKRIALDRDRTIFWLYYRQGFSPKAIADIAGFGLAVKGVESVISRLTKAVSHELAQAPSAHQSQRGTIARPLADQILGETRSPKKKKD